MICRNKHCIKIERYCKRIRKETERILYEMFGKKDSIKNYLQLKKQLKDDIENDAEKSIDKITADDFREKPYSIGYMYCKYKTLEKILNIYTESSVLSLIEKGEIK